LTILRILLRNYADFESALEEEARIFEAAHPFIRIELTSVGIHELHQAAISDGGLREGRYDLALLGSDWFAEGVASRALEDLHPWHRRLPIPDWPHGWPRSLTSAVVFDNYLSALPWHDGPECLVYRADMFSDPAARHDFRARFGRDLVPPATWEEFEQTARFFTKPATHQYGTVFAAFPDGHNTLYDFAVQIWSRGGEIVSAAGQPLVNSPPAAGALDFYRRIVNDPSVCHPRSPELDSTQSGDLFLEGEVAMMVNWFGFATRASREDSPLAGKVAIAPVPSANGQTPISLSAFWALGIGTGSRHKELAWEFLRFISTPERDLGMTRHGTVGVRLSTWRDPALQARIPAYREIEGISLGARQLPTGRQMPRFAGIVDQIVARALATTDPSPVILKDAQHEIDSKGIKFE
jgi:multiple sugar transport system substrate-binding protein